MSRTWKCIVASLVGTASLASSALGQATADGSRLVIKPAVVRTTGENQPVAMHQVHRRGVWVSPRAGVVVSPRRGVGIYVAPRYVPRYAPRYYGPQYYPRQTYGYQTYPGYGYTYPDYGYGYTPYYGW